MSPQECMENALWPKELAPSARVQLVVKLRAVETVLMEAPVIRDEPNHNRFVMTIADGEAFAIYRRVEKALVISHTEVPRAAAESARSLLARYSIMPANTEIGSFPPARSSPIGQGAILSTRTSWFTLTRVIEVQAAPSTSNAPSYFANSSDLSSVGIIASLA